MGGKKRQWATRNPRHTHSLRMQISCIISLYFLNNELSNNTVIETNRYVRGKIVEL
jgi:hypothetical protein